MSPKQQIALAATFFAMGCGGSSGQGSAGASADNESGGSSSGGSGNDVDAVCGNPELGDAAVPESLVFSGPISGTMNSFTTADCTLATDSPGPRFQAWIAGMVGGTKYSLQMVAFGQSFASTGVNDYSGPGSFSGANASIEVDGPNTFIDPGSGTFVIGADEKSGTVTATMADGTTVSGSWTCVTATCDDGVCEGAPDPSRCAAFNQRHP